MQIERATDWLGGMEQGEMLLRPRFGAIWQRTIGQDAEGAWFALDQGYSDPRRAYHNWKHIEAMLAGLDRARGEAEFSCARLDDIELAIWFHDAVYDPLAKDNEAKSAELFRASAGDALGREQTDRICGMILATTLHARDDDLSTRLLLDLDLRVLGGTPADYRRYVDAVRAEYVAVPADAWKTGRPAVLKRFLERPAIYQTAYFHRELEARARQNAAREIESLLA